MANQIGKFQPTVASYFKDWIVEAGRQLFDTCRFTTATRAEDVQWFLWVEEPDHNIAAGLMEDIVMVNGWRVGRRNGVAPDRGAGWFAAEDLPASKNTCCKALRCFFESILIILTP